uniref:Zinc transporter ZIP1 n=1 Tax=Caligus clemensi TaxID=344056 RepID=C1C0B5_CALCM|nr:Zinc transporter ZIP1 [Caligus clemensi]
MKVFFVNMSSLFFDKFLVTVGVLASTLIFGFLPKKLASLNSAFNSFLTLSSCFSGGVFLAAFFLDLLPDTEEAFRTAVEESHLESSFPLPGFVIMVGFFLVLILEQLVLAYKDRHQYELIPFEHEEQESDSSDGPQEFSVLRSFMLLIALSFHSFFEGLAIGLQRKENDLLALVFAVMFHKGIMAFSLGINLTRTNIVFKVFTGCILIFSFASPIGIAVGMGLMNLPESSARDITTCFLQAIAGGTFLYITFIEVLYHELSSDMREGPDRMLRLLGILLGFACMAILLLIFPV